MIEPERKKFDEIVERGKGGILLADDFEWLVTELDSYSKAWKTERDNMRKMAEIVQRMKETQEKLAGALKALVERAEQDADMEYEVRIAREALKNGSDLAG